MLIRKKPLEEYQLYWHPQHFTASDRCSFAFACMSLINCCWTGGLGGAENGPARIAAAISEFLLTKKDIQEQVFLVGTTADLHEVAAPIRRCFTHEFVQGELSWLSKLTIILEVWRLKLLQPYGPRKAAIRSLMNITVWGSTCMLCEVSLVQSTPRDMPWIPLQCVILGIVLFNCCQILQSRANILNLCLLCASCDLLR